MNCLNCNKDTTNPKFCSRSCAAQHNNKLYPKRKVRRKCTKCDNIVKSYRHTLCIEHWDEYQKYRGENLKNRTIGEYRKSNSVKDKHPSWIHACIRGLCRSWLKHLIKKPCANCGYDKHVELCHIKPLSSFEDSAKLSEVNSENNVIQLCRNCHWEFDNNLLELPIGS